VVAVSPVDNGRLATIDERAASAADGSAPAEAPAGRGRRRQMGKQHPASNVTLLICLSECHLRERCQH